MLEGCSAKMDRNLPQRDCLAPFVLIFANIFMAERLQLWDAPPSFN